MKPSNAPTMGERYEMAIAKERRLEAAAQPEVSSAAKKKAEVAREQEVRNAEARKKELAQKNGKKKRKQRMELNEGDLKNVMALEEKDEVQDGVDWSASDYDSSEDED